MHATYRAGLAKLDLARDKNLKPLRDDHAKELDALVIESDERRVSFRRR